MWGYYLNNLARMDLAITYDCNNLCYFCYAGCPRVTEELSTQEWKLVIDKIKSLGVPSVNFTGGEPTLRDDIVELVSYAGEGLSVGLITNGRLLSDDMCVKLKEGKLGHVQVTIHSFERMHDLASGVRGAWVDTINGVKSCLNNGIHVITNTTLMRNNVVDISEFIKYIYGIGIRSMCFNSLLVTGKGKDYEKDNLRLTYDELGGIVNNIIAISKGLGNMSIDWLQPTCYKKFNPIVLGLGVKNCSACSNNMTVEPSGRVIPCQSWIHDGCGNMLIDTWENIICSGIEKRDAIRQTIDICNDCRWIGICNGACPLDRGWVDTIDNKIASKELSNMVL
jgi:radical SAM protein with 4Fe4S-binding SPASM domain